jgi:hypothetical protein
LTLDRASIITTDVTSVEQIAERLGELEKKFAAAERERDEYRALYLETMERCRKLERGILASKSEHLPEGGAQLSLDVLSMVLGDRQRAFRGQGPPARRADGGLHRRAPRAPGCDILVEEGGGDR